MENRRFFVLRMYCEDLLCDESIESIFIKCLDIYMSENKIKLEIYFWYNDNKFKSKLLEFEKKHNKLFERIKIKKYNHEPNEFAWFNIIPEEKINTSKKYKFASTYKESNNLVTSIFDFFSFLKAATNKGELNNDSRSSRKSAIRKSIRHKKTNMESKK